LQGLARKNNVLLELQKGAILQKNRHLDPRHFGYLAATLYPNASSRHRFFGCLLDIFIIRQLSFILEPYDIPGFSHISCQEYLRRANEGLGPAPLASRERADWEVGTVLDKGMIDGFPVPAKYVERLPKTVQQREFVEHISQYACVPSGSKRLFLSSGSLVGAFSQSFFLFDSHCWTDTQRQCIIWASLH